MEKEKKIIYIMYGGLGDNLQFSTLPEMLTKKGYDVYISDQSEWRNQEIYDLVWALNPYIKGMTSEKSNCGSVIEYFPVIFADESIIYNWEALHKVKPTNKYPKIYYQPKFVEKYANNTFIDLCYSSATYDDKKLTEAVSRIVDEDMIEITFKSKVATKRGTNIEFKNRIVLENLFDYCDLIFSCKKLHTLFTGNSVLASAIIQCGEKKCDCIVDQSKYDHKIYLFDNINYTIC